MKRLLSFVTLLAAASSFAFASNHLWDMAQWKNNVVVDEGNTSGSVEYDGLKYYRGGGNAFADGAKEFSDGKTWNTRLKLGGKSTLSSKSASRVFEFTADKGDVVTLYVVHGSKTGTRTAYLSAERDTKEEFILLEVPTVDGGTGTAKVTLPEDGTYYVWADNNVGISCIRVDGIPTEYNNVKTAIEQTRNEWNDIAKDVAKYAVGNLTALFTGLNTQLNDKAKTIDEVEAELEALLKEHQAGGEHDWTWAAKEAELTGKLLGLNLGAFQAQLKNIEDMPLEDSYDEIKEAADSIAKLTVANAKTWAADSLGGEVTDSLETVINSIAAACAQGTLTSSSQFNGDLEKVSALVDNVLMRASEQDSITRAAVVATDTLQVARGIAASLEGQEFAAALLPSYKAGLDKVEAAITALQAEADKDTLRLRGYKSMIAEWTAENNANIQAVADTIAKYNGLLNTAAFNFQDNMADSVQKTYDEYYFLISAKYENEPDVQKDYQQQFAAIQVELSNERDTIDKRRVEVKSVEYNGTAVKNLEAIQGKVEDLWKKAQDAQSAAILAANDSLYKGLWKEIDDSLHTTYVDHIKSVEVYKGIAATAEGDHVAEAVNDAEAALFPMLDEINKLNDEAGEAYNKANQAIAYFDYDGFKDKADGIFDGMSTIIAQARSSVNTAAKNVFDQTVDSYYHEEYGYASGLIANAERAISGYDEDVKKFATDSLDVMNDSINTMKTLASGLYSRTTLPDSLDYCLSQLAFIPEAVDYLKAETFAHKEVADSLKNLSAYWTVAWSGKTDETKADLQDIYDEITALQGKVTESVGKMVESRESLLDEAADLYNKVFKYADPEAAAANDAAYEALTAAAAEIGTKLKEVAAAIDGYTEAVKNEYAPVADGYEAQLNGISECVEEAYASRTLAAGQEELQAQLDNLKTLVDSLAAEAAEAEAEATRTEGDLNGDNVVDASDFELMWQYVMDGSAEGDLNGDGTTNVIDVTILSNIYGAAE